jgi:hypothetical protein
MPKKLLATTIILSTILALVVSTIDVEVVDANPYPRDSLPDNGEFAVTIKTPNNNTLLRDGNIPLNFTVSYTEAWKAYPMWYYTASLSSIDVYLDGNKTGFDSQYGSNNYSGWINQTSPGQHMLNVTANFIIQYASFSSFPKVVSKAVYFTVEQQEPIPSAVPSKDTDLLSNSMALLTIAIVIVVVAVASISLVYFKRRKGKP